MKPTNAKSIDQIIREVVEASNLSENFARQRANSLWNDIVGPAVAAKTMRRYVDGPVLHVYISSAAIKNELQMQRSNIVKLLNEAVGSQAITELRIH